MKSTATELMKNTAHFHVTATYARILGCFHELCGLIFPATTGYKVPGKGQSLSIYSFVRGGGDPAINQGTIPRLQLKNGRYPVFFFEIVCHTCLALNTQIGITVCGAFFPLGSYEIVDSQQLFSFSVN